MVLTTTARTTLNSRRAGATAATLPASRVPRLQARRASIPPNDPNPPTPPQEPNPPADPEGPPGPSGPDGPDGPDPDPEGNNPPPNPDDNDDDSDNDVQGNLADAIKALAQSVSKLKEDRSKVREPDCFDGSDPKKLQTFLVQCRLNFEDRPSAFRTNRSKVTYALSYLKGTALDWFEPELADEDQDPGWLDDYLEFTQILRDNFGPYDPEGDAETSLENLVMRDNQRITRYIVDFNRYAAQIGWGNSALRHRFYSGLPARLKDEVSKAGKPKTLSELRSLAQMLDHRYWERDAEIKRENARKTRITNTPSSATTSNQTPSPNSNRSSNTRTTASTNKTGNTSTSADKPKQPAPDLASKLGKDGKLTTVERTRRLANNLCLFCGSTGHSVKDCTKATSSSAKAKARAAKVADSKTDTSSDSKK